MIEIYLKDTTIKLLPVSRKELKDLRGLLLKIQVAWLLADMAVGDVVMDSKVWGLMQKAIAKLPREDNPQAHWSDLDLLCSDYGQLQRLFFGTGQVLVANGELNLQDYTPGTILKAHYFSVNKFLLDCFNEVLTNGE